MIRIVDASVAIKWFVADEPFKDDALVLLDQIKDSPQEFAVPELFFNEMLSVLCRILEQPGLIHECLEALQDLGFERLGNGRAVLSEAVALAKQYGLSGYDAVYAANAKLTRGVWVTADETAYKKIEKLHVTQLLGGGVFP